MIFNTVVLMSVSLIGIIFIQYFFILKNYEENDKQFSINVNYVLEETTSWKVMEKAIRIRKILGGGMRQCESSIPRLIQIHHR
jgi:hypothetical protein